MRPAIPPINVLLVAVLCLVSYPLPAQETPLSEHYAQLREMTSREVYQLDSSDINTYYMHLTKLYMAGHMDSTAYYVEKMLPIAGSKSPFLGLAYLNLLSNVEIARGNYDHAISLLTETNERFMERKDHYQVALTYTNISSIYSYIEDYPNAERYAFMALKYGQLANDTLNTYGGALINIANAYSETDRLEEALVYYRRAMTVDSLKMDKSGISIISCNMGLVYLDLEKYSLGLQYLKRAFAIDSLSNNVSELVGTHHYLGLAYLKNDSLDKASYHLNRSNDLSQSTGINTYRDENYQARIELAIEQGNDSMTLALFHQFRNYQDSIFSKQRTDAIAEAEVLFDKKRVEDANTSLNEMNHLILKNKKRQVVFLVSLILLGGLVLLLTLYNRRKVISLNRSLEEQKRQLEDRNTQLNNLMLEKDNLMAIVAHDLKSPFTGILGLIDLLERDSTADEELDIKSMIKRLSNSGMKLINDIASVQKLETENAPLRLENQNVSSMLLEIINEFDPLAKAKQQKIRTEIPPNIEAAVQKDYLDRIVRNLLSNALKYSPKLTDIQVGVTQTASHYTLSFQDRGPGFSEKDKAKMYSKFTKLSAQPTGNEHSSGLGLYTVKLLTERLGGTVELKSNVSFGSEFVVTLSKKPNLN